MSCTVEINGMIFEAIASNDSENLHVLANDPKAYLDGHYGDDEHTMLIFAVRSGTPDAVRILVAAGAKIDEKDDDDMTALYTAAIYNRREHANVLIELGADTTICGDCPELKSIVYDMRIQSLEDQIMELSRYMESLDNKSKVVDKDDLEWNE